MKKTRYKSINVKDHGELIMIEFREKSFGDMKWLSREEATKLSKDINNALKGISDEM